MFPIEIISKITEMVIGDIGRDIISRGRDPKRRFARDLFAFYDAAQDYKGWCIFLLDLLEREKRIEPGRRMSWSTAYEAQKVSDDMAELVRTMVGKFYAVIRGKHLPLDRSSREATKRFKIVQIYDAQLAALMERASTIDLGVAYIAAAMAQQKFDDKTQKIIFLDPDSTDFFEAVACIDHDDAPVGRASFSGGKRYDLEKREIAKFLRTANFTDDKDFETFAEILHRSVALIDNLTESISGFIKSNFKMEDLL